MTVHCLLPTAGELYLRSLSAGLDAPGSSVPSSGSESNRFSCNVAASHKVGGNDLHTDMSKNEVFAAEDTIQRVSYDTLQFLPIKTTTK